MGAVATDRTIDRFARLIVSREAINRAGGADGRTDGLYGFLPM